jgi:hypothetical protein
MSAEYRSHRTKTGGKNDYFTPLRKDYCENTKIQSPENREKIGIK